MKTAQRKSFPVYTSWKKPLEKMSLEEKGVLLENLMRYHCNEQLLEMSDKVEMFWDTIEYNLEDNNKKYQAKVDTIKQNSKTNTKLQNTRNKEIQYPISGIEIPNTKSNETQYQVSKDKVNVNVKVNDNDNEKVNEKVKDEVNVNNKVNVKTSYEVIGKDNEGFPIIKTPVSKSSIEREKEFDSYDWG